MGEAVGLNGVEGDLMNWPQVRNQALCHERVDGNIRQAKLGHNPPAKGHRVLDTVGCAFITVSWMRER
jgi:hypothetical protein